MEPRKYRTPSEELVVSNADPIRQIAGSLERIARNATDPCSVGGKKAAAAPENQQEENKPTPHKDTQRIALETNERHKKSRACALNSMLHPRGASDRPFEKGHL